jgi:hypothetical protein
MSALPSVVQTFLSKGNPGVLLMLASARLLHAVVPHGARPSLLSTLQPFEYPVVNAMHLGGKALVTELRPTAADDDVAIGERVGVIGHRGLP